MCVCVCGPSVVDKFAGLVTYYMPNDTLTWSEAAAKCGQGNGGYLATVFSADMFTFLKGMYNQYIAKGGNADGAWIDGKYNTGSKVWQCQGHSPCYGGIPWSVNEPNYLDTEHCVLVWRTHDDGVINYSCDVKFPAICMASRYGVALSNSCLATF